jgi:hypothetical protein
MVTVDQDSDSERIQSTGPTSNVALAGTQHPCRHQFIYHEAANTATEHLTQDAKFKVIHRTGSSENKMLHAAGCEDILI